MLSPARSCRRRGEARELQTDTVIDNGGVPGVTSLLQRAGADGGFPKKVSFLLFHNEHLILQPTEYISEPGTGDNGNACFCLFAPWLVPGEEE
jgi:hypothetical protein